MSKIAVHIDPDTEKILGVWTQDSSGLKSYYPQPYQRQLGADKMLDFVDHQKNDPPETQATWDMWCDQLAGRTPVDIWWESIDSTKDETLEQTFQRLST